MPFQTNKELPNHVKKFSEKVQSQWRHVFNSVFNKVLKETRNRKQAEKRAFMAGNSVLKTRMNKRNQDQLQSDFFEYLVQDYLKNLQG